MHKHTCKPDHLAQNLIGMIPWGNMIESSLFAYAPLKLILRQGFGAVSPGLEAHTSMMDPRFVVPASPNPCGHLQDDRLKIAHVQ